MVINYDERVQGWTAFHSYTPDLMLGMNNKFFSFKDGNLYLHDSLTSDRNTFYGEFSETKISHIVNEDASNVKEMLALKLEGNDSWDAVISAYVSSLENPISSTIAKLEFVKKEGMWYAYTRRNEDATHFDSKSTYGIGRITAIAGNTITYNGGNSSLTVGDKIVKGSTLAVIGEIQSMTNTTLTLDVVTGLVVDDFIVGMKDARTEGGGLRGYTFRVDLTSDRTEKLELFAVNAEIIRSYS